MRKRRNDVIKLIFFIGLSYSCWWFLSHRPELRGFEYVYEDSSWIDGDSNGSGNFEPENERVSHGVGEGGKPCYLHDPNYITTANEYGINMECSNAISLHRSIPDTRMQECKYRNYPYDLPPVSVIVLFQNAPWTTLIRAVYSVLRRTPSRFLKEIIVVDDFSEVLYLDQELEKYFDEFDTHVKVLRNSKKLGPIRSRTRAAEAALADVIVFLNGFCEVNVNWLPPLLEPIYRNPTTLTVPIVDWIDHTTFQYRSKRQIYLLYHGIFDWNLFYREHELPPQMKKQRKRLSDPYETPTYAGGFFAIQRDFFLSVGAYDSHLLDVGGENLALSFKIWRCGGKIEFVPCSRIGDIFTGYLQHELSKTFNQSDNSPVLINQKRIVETWFDPKYREYFYTRIPQARFIDHGSISNQLELQKRLQCKSFHWYMSNVAYDVFHNYPKPPKNAYWGQLLNIETQKCLTTLRHGSPDILYMLPCDESQLHQSIRLNVRGQLGVGVRCIESDYDKEVKIVTCPLRSVEGPWMYNEKDWTLFHRIRKKCAVVHHKTNRLVLTKCYGTVHYYKWTFLFFSPKSDSM